MKVVLQNLTKVFPSRDKKLNQEVVAVNDFSFEIPDGKLIGLLGPSGCGKSTTLYVTKGKPAHRHMPYNFSTCIKPSSSGVLRPKILTITFNFFLSLLISSITASNPLKGPSVTFMLSPISNGIMMSSGTS